MDSFEAVNDNELANEKPTAEMPKSPYLDNIDSPDELGEDSQGSSHSKARDEEEGKDAVDSREENPGTPEEMEVDYVQQQGTSNDEEPSESAEAVENEDSTIDGKDVCGNEKEDPASPEPEVAESNSPEKEDLPTESGPLSEAKNELETPRDIESPAEPMEVDEADNRTKGVDADTSCDGEQNESHQPAEEVDCSAMSYAEDKENSESIDPFESLKNSSDKIQNNIAEKENDTSARQSNNDEDASLQNNQDEDSTTHTNQDDDSEDESVQNDVEDSRQSGRSTPIRDDGEEASRGADECLVDEVPEFSEADMQRAIEAKEADDKENDIIDEDVEGVEDDLSSTEKQNDGAIDAIDASEQVAAEETVESESTVAETNPYEITEQEQATSESLCFECGSITSCRYSFAQMSDSPEEASAADSAPPSEVHHLCAIDCVTKFREKNDKYEIKERKVEIQFALESEQTCFCCSEAKICKFRFADAGTSRYVCEDECIDKMSAMRPGRYTVNRSKIIVSELKGDLAMRKCIQCTDEKECIFSFQQGDEVCYLCNNTCLNLLLSEQPDRFQLKLTIRVRDMAQVNEESVKVTKPKMIARSEKEVQRLAEDRQRSFLRHCKACKRSVDAKSLLMWETMDFCRQKCLKKYQTIIGSCCASCKASVSVQALGKYCVRFGFEMRQFCRSECLNAYKKGWKVCSHCQTKITKSQEYLALMAGVLKEFCSYKCSRFYEAITEPKKQALSRTCAVCNKKKTKKVTLLVDRRIHNFCSNPCFSAFKFVNNISPDECTMCKQFFERKTVGAQTIYHDNEAFVFCSKICLIIHVVQTRQIEPCHICKVRKYSYDMIRNVTSKGPPVMLCSLQCLSMAEMSMNAVSNRQTNCNQCKAMSTPQYHLTMSDSSIRNFCTYQCVMAFQSQFARKPLTLDDEDPSNNQKGRQLIPVGLPKRVKASQPIIQSVASLAPKSQKPTKTANKSNSLMISSVTSLAPKPNTRRSAMESMSNAGTLDLRTMLLQPVVELEPLPASVVERSTVRTRSSRPEGSSPAPAAPPPTKVQTRIITIPKLPSKVSNRSTQCEADSRDKSVQCRPVRCTVGTQTDSYLEKKMVIPIPVPIYMPQPLPMYAQPMPIPVPFPLPIPVPIFIPTTRNSASGIMKEIKKIQDKMPEDPFQAELLLMAEMVASENKKVESDSSSDEEPSFGNDVAQENSFGEDVIQMALKFANEYDGSANPVDMESAMTVSAISQHTHPGMHHTVDPNLMHNQQMAQQQMQIQPAVRKRGPITRSATGTRPPSKRLRKNQAPSPPAPSIEPVREPVEKADAHMCLKFTFGVNAWKQWVMTKNTEIEKSSAQRKPFKTELLQMNADELNYSLCLFVKEVRKPNGSEYAPDTIYYLVLGIQQYLYENSRIDNIFTDTFYERFTDCLDEVARKFSVLYNDSQYIVTRVEEEHLWECKQLGAHSPHVLLSTLMFFNTKHFNLTTVDEHMQLSFSHIMKHWKRNPNQASAKIPAGARNVLLRFYPPQTGADGPRKKKVYEQQENDENPLRCPVKLYEFYLSKCPESVKTRNDVFYLMPERSCVPESPVWYSTQPLNRGALSKMLHRVKMVKEINIALLTS